VLAYFARYFVFIPLVITLVGLVWLVYRPVYKDIPSIRLKSLAGSILDFRAVMYHRISDWQEQDSQLTKSLKVSPAVFETQLKRYASQGFHTITADQLYRAYIGKVDLPKNAIILTFDDGFVDSYTNAFRLLKQYGMVGEFAIITALIDQSNFVTTDNLKEMQEYGMGISSHTVSHCNLVANVDKQAIFSDHEFLDPILDNDQKPCKLQYGFDVLTKGQVEYELIQSKLFLERTLNTKVISIVYPIGAYNRYVLARARAMYGIGFATTSSQADILSDPLAIPRTRIKGIQ
jgi:peptidoglycan/xylan/chitin deacetylase (PgdA/CDA1 family)